MAAAAAGFFCHLKQPIHCKCFFKALTVHSRAKHFINYVNLHKQISQQTYFPVALKSPSTLVNKAEEKLVISPFEDIVNCAVSDLTNRNLSEVAQWLKKALYYNVPHGKKNRGTILIKSYEMIAPQQDLTPQNLYLAQILGWCTEICQAFFLIEDDIMDQSVTRRGRPCWYQNEGVGLVGINDGMFLSSLIFLILKRHFSEHPSYVNLMETFNNNIWLTLAGQSLDMLSSPASSRPDLTKFSLDRYYKIVIYKTAYYTFALPVTLSVLLAGKKDSYTEAVEDILMKIGQYFQVQDDILDCFGDPKVMGKVGTDIEDGKCAWPIAIALEKVTPEQYSILQENYGVHNETCVKLVKEVYNDLGILELFSEYESQTYSSICAQIERLPSSCEIPKTVFHNMLNAIYKRNK